MGRTRSNWRTRSRRRVAWTSVLLIVAIVGCMMLSGSTAQRFGPIVQGHGVGNPSDTPGASSGQEFPEKTSAQIDQPQSRGPPIRTSPDTEGFSVAKTLVLFNDSVVPGNFLAGDGASPCATIYDNRTGEILRRGLGFRPRERHLGHD